MKMPLLPSSRCAARIYQSRASCVNEIMRARPIGWNALWPRAAAKSAAWGRYQDALARCQFLRASARLLSVVQWPFVVSFSKGATVGGTRRRSNNR